LKVVRAKNVTPSQPAPSTRARHSDPWKIQWIDLNVLPVLAFLKKLIQSLDGLTRPAFFSRAPNARIEGLARVFATAFIAGPFRASVIAEWEGRSAITGDLAAHRSERIIAEVVNGLGSARYVEGGGVAGIHRRQISVDVGAANQPFAVAQRTPACRTPIAAPTRQGVAPVAAIGIAARLPLLSFCRIAPPPGASSDCLTRLGRPPCRRAQPDKDPTDRTILFR
jgi:hypothetical protein